MCVIAMEPGQRSVQRMLRLLDPRHLEPELSQARPSYRHEKRLDRSFSLREVCQPGAHEVCPRETVEAQSGLVHGAAHGDP